MRWFTSTTSRAFTLIELLVVIAIIGLLSSVVLASLSGAREEARDARRQSDMQQIRTALEMLYNDCGVYPRDPSQPKDIEAAVIFGADCPSSTTVGDYMSQIPKDPSGGSYQYVAIPSGQSYCLGTQLEGDNAPDDDVSCGLDGTLNNTDSGGNGALYSIQSSDDGGFDN